MKLGTVRFYDENDKCIAKGHVDTRRSPEHLFEELQELWSIVRHYQCHTVRFKTCKGWRTMQCEATEDAGLQWDMKYPQTCHGDIVDPDEPDVQVIGFPKKARKTAKQSLVSGEEKIV